MRWINEMNVVDSRMRPFIALSEGLFLSILLVAGGCYDEECADSNGENEIIVPTQGGTLGSARRVSRLVICPANLTGTPEYTVLATEVVGDVYVRAWDARFSFPNLTRVGGLISVVSSDVAFPVLEQAVGSVYLSAEESHVFEAPVLHRASALHADNFDVVLPALAVAEDIFLSELTGPADLHSLTAARKVSVTTSASLDLSSLVSVGYLMAANTLTAPVLTSLTAAGDIYLSGTSSVRFEVPVLERATSLHLLENPSLEQLDLPLLRELSELTAINNPALRTCDLVALANAASVPAGAVTLEGNSAAPCQ